MPNNNENRRPAKPNGAKGGAKKPNNNGNKQFNKPKGPAPARVAALEALMDVQISDAYAGLALTGRIASAKLNALDRRLMTELFYGVLENRIHLDYILSKYMERPCEDDITLQILRMGVYQLIFIYGGDDRHYNALYHISVHTAPYLTSAGLLLSNFHPGIRYCIPMESSRAPLP